MFRGTGIASFLVLFLSIAFWLTVSFICLNLWQRGFHPKKILPVVAVWLFFIIISSSFAYFSLQKWQEAVDPNLVGIQN